MNSEPTDRAPFDAYASDYEAELARGISVSGETRDYFARARVSWLAGRVEALGFRAGSGMDFGCGTGTTTPHLLDALKLSRLEGVDTSSASIEMARERFASERVCFRMLADCQPNAEVDLAYCNGVFHHIPIAQRAGVVSFLHRALRSGGMLALWENNPWNPGTRYVMSRIPFDRDAIPLSAPSAARMLRHGGFEVLRRDFLFFFPRFLAWFRGLEPVLKSIPLGAQYLVLGRKG